MTHTVLRIDASARREGSISRALNDRLIARFAREGEIRTVTRDLAFDPGDGLVERLERDGGRRSGVVHVAGCSIEPFGFQVAELMQHRRK